MHHNLQTAIKLRSEDKLKESNSLLMELLNSDPNDPYLNYQVAWSFDILEKETDAVYFYEKAIANKLQGNDLAEAFIGLGSTYRAIGKYELAKKTLLKGIAEFPDNNTLKIFYSMVLYNKKQYGESMEILLKIIATTSNDQNVIAYRKAIKYYSDKLNCTFD